MLCMAFLPVLDTQIEPRMAIAEPGAAPSPAATATASPTPMPLAFFAATPPAAVSSPVATISPAPSSSPSPAATGSAAASAATVALAGNPAASAAPPPPVAGDLTHLVATATRDLHVAFVSPDPETAQSTLAAVVEVLTGAGQVPELSVNGATVPWAHLGWRQQDPRERTSRYRYYGVPLVAGPNTLTAVALGADGLRSDPVELTVFGPGDPVALSATVSGKLVADGKTAATLTVNALDRWNHFAAAGSIVKVSIASGDASLIVPPEPDANNVMPPLPATAFKAVDVALKPGGTRALMLVPGLTAGDVTLRASLGDLVAERTVFIAPYVRPAMVMGLVSGGAGAVPGQPSADAGIESGSDSRRGRVALYATGGIGTTASVTAAYDSASGLTSANGNALALYDPNQSPYATYGDASVKRDDALSGRHMYLHVDVGRSSLVWGQFQAASGPSTGLSGFNLLLDGERLILAGKRQKLTLFTAKNSLAYARQVFVPSGLGVLNGALQPNIVPGSDAVTLVVLDRHSGIVLSQTALTRNVDYALDYATGDLRFIDVILPYDPNFNPQEVLIQYQYAGGVAASTLGGRYEATLGHDPDKSLKVGMGYVNDGYGSGNVALFSQDLSGPLGGGTFSLEHLGTTGILPTQILGQGVFGTRGDAYRATVNYTGPTEKLSAGFETTTLGYDNPFGGLTTPGLLDYHAQYERTTRAGGLTLSFERGQNIGTGGISSQTNAEAAFRQSVGRGKRMTVTSGIKLIGNGAGTIDTQSPLPGSTSAPLSITPNVVVQAEAGIEWKASNTLSFAANDVTDLTGGSSTTNPSEMSTEVDWALPKNGKFFIRRLWSSAATSSFAATTQSLTAPVLGKSATSIGFERDLGSATVSSDYSLQQTANGEEVTSGIGVKDRFQIAKRLRGNVFFQRGSEVGSVLSEFDLYGLTFSYSEPTGHFKSTGSYQLRTGESAGSSVFFGAAGALSPVLSTFTQINGSKANGLGSEDDKVGFAYRPLSSDRFVSLLEYESGDGNTATTPTRTSLVSFEQAYEPTSHLQLAGRFAYKLDGDAYYPVHSRLAQLRLTQRLGARNDLTLETSSFGVAGIPSAGRTALAVETGFRVGDGLRLAVGDNLRGSVDPSLAAQPAHRGFYFTVTSVIDQIFGWGR